MNTEPQRLARMMRLCAFGMLSVLMAGMTCAADLNLPIAEGPFRPTAESLKEYQYPDWFGTRNSGSGPNYWDLYHFPAEPGDRGWYSKNPRWQQQWFNEIKELVDNYHPDLLYSDGSVPFGNEVGYSLLAHLYNDSVARHNGHVQLVFNCKQKSEGRWVEDLESCRASTHIPD